MLKISRDRLPELFEALSADAELYLPAESAGQVNFTKYESGVEYSDALKTVKSAKDIFFAQSENIVSFERTDGKLSVTPNELPNGKTVLFGVRACDLTAFEVLDRVFLSEPADRYYKARRESCTIIAQACAMPEESCFCTVFGIDPAEPSADVCTWLDDCSLYWQAQTEKGREVTERLESLFESCESDEVEKQKRQIKDITAKLPLTQLSLDKWGVGKTAELFDAEQWKSLSESCLGCGACTFVCPTCQCYDIRDYNNGRSVQRYRCWDSCMYSDFTMMAHGTPRPDQLQRFRQRFMHKLVYFPDNNDGMYSCVGCGRCVTKCPVSMNIAKVIKAFGGEK